MLLFLTLSFSHTNTCQSENLTKTAIPRSRSPHFKGFFPDCKNLQFQICVFLFYLFIFLQNESGVCSLYLKSEQSNRTHLQLGPSSVCNYLIAFGTIGMLVYGFGLIMYCIWLAVMSARHQRTKFVHFFC